LAARLQNLVAFSRINLGLHLPTGRLLVLSIYSFFFKKRKKKKGQRNLIFHPPMNADA
jgi:hypothetical protein